MSCYFDVKIKRKGLPVSDAPTLITLCTTPARELSSNVSLVFDAQKKDDEYGYWTILDMDKLDEIITYYDDEVDSYKQSIRQFTKELEEYREMLPKAASAEIFDTIRENINDLTNSLAWAKEDLEIKEYRLYDFNNLKSIIGDNSKFELVYYLG